MPSVWTLLVYLATDQTWALQAQAHCISQPSAAKTDEPSIADLCWKKNLVFQDLKMEVLRTDSLWSYI